MKLILVAETADILQVSEQRVYEMVRTGVLPAGVAIRLGRQVRIDADALNEWIAAGGQSLPGVWRRDVVARPNDSESIGSRTLRARR